MIVQQLNLIQRRYGYLPQASLVALGARLAVPLYRLQEVISFFPHFRTEPPPEVEIHVCRDMTCHLRGSAKMIADLQYLEEAEPGRVRVCGVSCLGRCDRAPAVRIEHNRPAADEENEDPGHDHHRLFSYFGRSCKEIGAAATSLLTGATIPAVPPDTDAALPGGKEQAENWTIDIYKRQPANERYRAVRRVIDEMFGFKPLQGHPWLQKRIRRNTPQEEKKRDELIQTSLKNAVLLGMGGAGGQAFKKWADVRKADGKDKYVVCNADESEPGTFKDREILLRTPYLVVEGVILAGLMVGAKQGYIYIRHEYEECIEAVEKELEWAKANGVCGDDVLGSGEAMAVEVFVSPGGYICGEQTALIQAMEDKRAEPRIRPPELQTNGLWDMPTLVNNVETLAWAPAIFDNEAAGVAASGSPQPNPDQSWYGGLGRGFGPLAAHILGPLAEKIFPPERDWKKTHGPAARFPGARFFSISGDVNRPGVYEVENGITVRELLEQAGGVRGNLKAIAFSGPSGGFTPRYLPPTAWPKKLKDVARELPLPGGLDICELQMHLNYFRNCWNLMLGAGIVVYNDQADLVDQARACQRFFKNESCGKCVPCRIGSTRFAEFTERLLQGHLTAEEQERVRSVIAAAENTLTADEIERRGMGPLADLKSAMKETAICGLGDVAPNPLATLLRYFPGEVERYLSLPVA